MDQNTSLFEGLTLRHTMFLRQVVLCVHVIWYCEGWYAAESAWDNLKCTWKETEV